MHGTNGGRRVAAGLVGIAALALSACAPARAADGPAAAIEDLRARLEGGSARADFVVVLDLSGSMLYAASPGAKRPVAAPHRRIDVFLHALPALLEAIPEGDYFSLVAFHDTVIEDPALVIPSWDPARSPAVVLERLRREPALQPNRRGNTDLGRALDVVFDKLTRTDRAPIQFVYFVTDGQHDVGRTSSSPYRAEAGEAPWTELKSKWATATGADGRVLRGYLVGLYDVADPGRIGQVMPDVAFLPAADAASLGAFFAEQKDRIERDKLRARLELEMQGVTLQVAPVAEHLAARDNAVVDAPLRVAAGGSKLDFVASVTLRPSGEHAALACATDRAEVSLAGADTAAAPVAAAVVATTDPWLRGTEEVAVSMAWTAELRVDHPVALAELGVQPPTKRFDGTFVWNASLPTGRLSYWLLALAAVTAVVVFILVRRLIPPVMNGRVDVFPSERKVVAHGARWVVAGEGADVSVRVDELRDARLVVAPRRKGLRWRFVLDEVTGEWSRDDQPVRRSSELRRNASYVANGVELRFQALRLARPVVRGVVAPALAAALVFAAWLAPAAMASRDRAPVTAQNCHAFGSNDSGGQ